MFLAIDLDAFYCGVEERLDPTLRDATFCVVQKEVVATLSYPARALGIPKLSNVRSVLQKHPDMRIVNGENLAKYRQAGKQIFEFVELLIGGLAIERLGLEEMRFDLGDEIAQMSRDFPPAPTLLQWLDDDDFMDDVGGSGATLKLGGTPVEFPDFYFQFDGHTFPPGRNDIRSTVACSLDAYIAGHLAVYIRDRIWLELGYSCSIGVGSTKNLAKMVGAVHKPRGVTVLLPGHEPEFVRSRPLSKVPGLGRAGRQALQGEKDETVGELLTKYSGAELQARLAPLIGQESAAGLYSLLIGEDLAGRTIKRYTRPQQISMEESFATFSPEADWAAEVQRLSSQVLEQALIDWFNDETLSWDTTASSARVACIFANQAYVRKSRSQRFTWTALEPSETIAERLSKVALPLLRDLATAHHGRPRVINIALVT